MSTEKRIATASRNHERISVHRKNLNDFLIANGVMDGVTINIEPLSYHIVIRDENGDPVDFDSLSISPPINP